MDETIGEAVSLLLAKTKQSREQLAMVMRCSTKTIGRRIRGEEPWLAWEVAAVAEHFGVPVQKLYDGADALFSVPVINRSDTSPPGSSTLRYLVDAA